MKFWIWHLCLPLLIAAFMLFVYPQTHLDQLLQSRYYSPELHRFPLKHDPFMENFMHDGLKYLAIAIALCVLAAYLWSLASGRMLNQRRRLLWLFAALLTGPAVVSLLKHYSIHACPWDIVDYGGTQPLLALFDALPAGIKPGRCFPGGHASGGFALLAFYYALRDNKPGLAGWLLAAALLLGFVMGWSQQVRGAHFFSHTIWSAWVVWMVLLALYLIWPPQVRSGRS